MKETIQVILDSSLALVAILIILACLGTVLANLLSGGTHADLDSHKPKPSTKHPKHPNQPKP